MAVKEPHHTDMY